jgi:hypothetical protein
MGQKSVLLIISLLFFLGCSSKDQTLFDNISYKKEKFANLRDGEKLIFHRGKDDEFILVVNYILDEKDALEKFVISSNVKLESNTTITLNGKKPKQIKEIKYKTLSPSLKVMVPQWSNIYLVTFDELKKSKILTFFIELDGEKKKVKFYKKPKYLFRKPSFKK